MFIAKDNGYILTEADLRFLIETKSILNEGIVDWLQSGLDVVGLIPGVGEVADGINAVISVARGNYLDMVFSIISMIPAAGDVFGKAGKYLTRALEPVAKFIKAGDDAGGIISKLGPTTWAKIKPVIDKIAPTIQKYKDKIAALFDGLAKGDADKVAANMGIEVPEVFQKKFGAVIEKYGPDIADSGIDQTIDFIANSTIREAGLEDEEEPAAEEETGGVADLRARMGLDPIAKKEPSKDISGLRDRLGLSESKYIHHVSLSAHLYGQHPDVYHDLKSLAESIRQTTGTQ